MWWVVEGGWFGRKNVVYTHVKNPKNIFNLFLEPSTRTTVSFELAAKKLGYNSINIKLSIKYLEFSI